MAMRYNWRDRTTRRTGKAFDAATGEPVRGLFEYDTETHQVGRFQTAVCVGDGVEYRISRDGKMAEVWETRELRLEWADEADAPTIVEGK